MGLRIQIVSLVVISDALSPLLWSTCTSSSLHFYLNGTKITLTSRKLKGTKLGCGEDGCGTYTVVVQDAPDGGMIEHLAVNACLALVLGVEGKHVITIEALGTAANPHPLQERIAKLHGSQCDFCTPGVVMRLYALLWNSYDPTAESEGTLDGNPRRCTGYKPILDAAKSFVRENLGGVAFEGKKSKVEGELGGNYISGKKGSGTGRPGGCSTKPLAGESSSDETESSSETSIAVTEEAPLSGATYGAPLKTCGRDDCCQLPSGGHKAATEAEVLGSYEPHTEITYPPALRKYTKQPIFYGNEKKVWFRPTTIEQLVELKCAYPSAKIVEVKFKHEKYGVSVYVGFKGFSIDGEKGAVVIGGNTSLTVLEKTCLEGYKKLGRRGQLRWSIRNTTTPTRDILTTSLISDLNPVLIASGTVLTAQSKTRGEFPLPMKELFVTYRTTALPADSIITKLAIPLPGEGTREVIKSYKQAKRKDDDIAIITARFRVVLDESSVVTDISLAYGRMALKTVEAKSTMEAFLDKKWFDNTVLEGALAAMEKDFPLGFIVPGGMPTYRKTLAFSFLFRFWHGVAAESELGTQEQQVDHEVIEEIHGGISYGSRDNANPYEQRVVGKQIPHLPRLKKLLETPPPGVVSFVGINDLDDERILWGSVKKDEPSFAKDFSAVIAQAAAQLVDMLIRGKPTAEAFKGCDFVYEGVAMMGGQEHFYLKANAAAVIPRPEDGEMEVWSSTENIMETQEFVPQVTGVPSSRVVVKVKGMGGGFGGKVSRSVQLACILAVGAKKVGRPIRCMLNRDEDIKVGVSKDGMLQVLDADVDNNAGFSQDFMTNTHPNTAFRGFGAPHGQYIAECIMAAIAGHLKMSNSYKEGQLTLFPQPLEDLHAESDYDACIQQVEEFNRTHKWKKRGISLIPTKFVHLNQAGALVHIYNDGSVLLAHGGTEMGQGLYTKMCQTAAQELNCPLHAIFTSETSNTVANTSPTAASAGSDLNGMAVQYTCQQLNARLEPFRQKYGADAPLKTLAHVAYLERVNLTANGYYKMPTIGYGTAISEVELDVLTGSHPVLHTDIKMDVGRSINPAIDYGQIEGAFVQGQGLFTMEETLWQKNGELFTRGPGAYKIPGFADIPQVFNVGFLKGVKWAKLRSIQSPKGIGEPPLFLGASVLFALREAVKVARESLEVLQLDCPAPSERMKVAVGDWIVRWAKVEAKGEKGFLVEAMA
ncbi:xanthine dehydrogenase [Choiromyces venosus 120613-1]|uniref:Xanthine dehydrogenase n=1 Tax=Choiromyces venosus 120613-1 TaxID=1336337 RepID=A0A3N4J534_9PEZI|nr:xanthine dehydrogenase [Choiromyces venosus 120613-1]